jgi:hypothetical protein
MFFTKDDEDHLLAAKTFVRGSVLLFYHNMKYFILAA